MFNFRKKLTKNEKLDFLEYLAFQVKSDMSFEKALVRYNSNQNRKKHVLETCDNTIQDIRNGKTPADALFDNELIERLEYGIVKNGKSNKELYESLTSIININKGNINNSNELQKAVRSGVLLIVFVDLSSLWKTFNSGKNTDFILFCFNLKNKSSSSRYKKVLSLIPTNLEV